MTDFYRLIIDWYRQNSRDLPWRNTKNPYKIWLSEIILQQTRVDQGMNYYHKFLKHYPTINHLANATEQEILNDWQGLGYYSRARNLHATAKYITYELNGVFPSSYKEIIKLKGVGPYTAAAIASFAFREPKALVDGNVYRVLSRHFDISTPIDSTIGKKEFQELADELIPKNEPDIYNQAIMEFGSQYCTPTKPNCESCVLSTSCLAYAHNTVNQRPIKVKKTVVRDRFFYYFIFTEKHETVLEKRTEKDIWQHLYQFPLLETNEKFNEHSITQYTKTMFQATANHISEEVKHILSHQRIHARFIHVHCIPTKFKHQRIAITDIINYPLPRLIDRYLENTTHPLH